MDERIRDRETPTEESRTQRPGKKAAGKKAAGQTTASEPGKKMPVDTERVRKFQLTLEKYRTGKKRLESRIKEAERWWKLRNEEPEQRESENAEGEAEFHTKSGWLHNVLVSKHADAMDSYPEALILPREEGDVQEAATLSAVLPVIFDQTKFEKVYSAAWWDKLKTGTAVYQVKWDSKRHNGLGDVEISTADLLSLYWEPGIEDIQDSRYLFHTRLRDNELLEEEYPQLKGKLKGGVKEYARYPYDDQVSTEGKSMVVDVYYKRQEQGRTVLHYCKYVGEEVLYATENEAAREREARDTAGGFGQGEPTAQPGALAQADGMSLPNVNDIHIPGGLAPAPDVNDIHIGLYDDGKYPFVFDVLWPIKGSPCGYGYVDLCRNPQMMIDLMDAAFLKNFQVNVMPRYFSREDGNVNEEEFLNLKKPIVHVSGSVDETSLRSISSNFLSGNYIGLYRDKISELRETSGNTESANGVYNSGVTAASAIAAMQEASGKTSRDASKGGYRAFGEIVEMTIERVRQFYTLPRCFRIKGERGEMQFKAFDNSGLVPQDLGGIGNEHLGYRLPTFDIRVEVQKKNAYTRTSQNELILNFFDRGFFNPQFATQAMACAELLDFDGKDAFLQTLQRNGSLFEQLQQVSALLMQMAQKYEPQNAAALAQQLGAGMAPAGGGGRAGAVRLDAPTETGENKVVEKARQRANSAAQVKR